MSLKQKIQSDLKFAMKSGDTAKRDTLRMLDSMIKNVEIEKKKKEAGLDERETQEVIARAIKQRKDSIDQYTAGGRNDLAEKEKHEVEILAHYMPEQMNGEEIKIHVKEIISQTGATSQSDTGKVMGAVMAKLKGKADGQAVKKVVEAELK